jgi:hypothetical protein
LEGSTTTGSLPQKSKVACQAVCITTAGLRSRVMTCPFNKLDAIEGRFH